MCISGKCLKFDGTDNYVDAGTPTNLGFSGDQAYTLSAWIKPISTRNDGSFISYGNAGIRKIISINSDSAGKIYSVHYGDDHSFTTSWQLNSWQHVVITYDPTTSTESLYVNGVYKEQWSPANLNLSSGEKLYIGKATWNNTYVNTSFIDDVKIYPYVRTASQIKTDAASKIPSVHGISTSFGDDQSYLSNGLVGYWKMDDGVNNPCASGVDKACDSSGNGNVGTWTNGVASTSGKFGNGTNYDGVDDYVDVGDILDMGTSNWTISQWIKHPDTSAWSAGIDKRINVGGGDGYGYKITNTGLVSDYFGGSAASTYFTNSTRVVDDNIWHHITVVYNRTGNMTIYIDGVADGTIDISAENGYNVQTSNTLRFGAGHVDSSLIPEQVFNGSIDETRIYNRALSPSEITRLYDWAPGPVGWWKMDENTGQSANDTSSNANTGTLGSGNGADPADPIWTRGKFGSALKFDGVDDYVALPTPPPSYFYPKTNESFAVAAWIKTTQTSQGYIITHSTGGTWSYDSWRLGINEAYTGPNELDFHAVAQGGASYAVTIRKANAGVNDGNWHLVVVTKDTSGNWIMYVDGKSVATASWNGDVQDNNHPMTIGAIYVVDTVSYSSYFNGLIDDVRVYNYALTPTQIKLLYNGDSAVRFGPLTGSP